MSRTRNSLSGIKLFRSLDEEARATLERACGWRRIAAKEWVIDAQDEGNDVFFVIHGQLQVIVSLGNREAILRDLREGEYFGELAAIDQEPRSASIRAITDAVLAKMPASHFCRVIHEHPDVCDQVLQSLANRIRALANRANEASGLTMKSRLWSELLRLASARPVPSNPPIVSPPPTHAELAARVVSHREAVTRELSALERQGLIARRRGAIVLVDAPRLRDMVRRAGEA